MKKIKVLLATILLALGMTAVASPASALTYYYDYTMGTTADNIARDHTSNFYWFPAGSHYSLSAYCRSAASNPFAFVGADDGVHPDYFDWNLLASGSKSTTSSIERHLRFFMSAKGCRMTMRVWK